MNPIKRELEKQILSHLAKISISWITGTRRVGQIIFKQIIRQHYSKRTLILNTEDFDVQELLKSISAANYKRILGGATLLITHEAQAPSDIGRILKLQIETISPLTILATGRSSFDLSNKTGNHLMNRQFLFHLYPLSQRETGARETRLETVQDLKERLIFGSYPELFPMATYQEKTKYLLDLTQSYLIKDIHSYEGIRHADKITRLLRLLAYPPGHEVSYTALAGQLGLFCHFWQNT